MAPKVSIIVPCRRGNRSVSSFLPLIHSCLIQSEKKFEFIFVSDGFDPDLQLFFHQNLFQDRRFFLLMGSGMGANGARHFGATAASGEFLYFLDDDCELTDANHLARLLELNQLLEVDSIIGGAYLDKPDSAGGYGYNQFVDAWLKCGSFETRRFLGLVFEVENLVGGNFFLSRQLYFRRPLNTSIPIFGDETEFFRGHRCRGTKLFLSESISVFHSEKFHWKKFFRRAWQSGKQRESFGLKTQLGLWPKIIVLCRSIQQKKVLIPFFMVHFFVLYLSVGVQKFKKLSEAVSEVGADKQEGNPYYS